MTAFVQAKHFNVGVVLYNGNNGSRFQKYFNVIFMPFSSDENPSRTLGMLLYMYDTSVAELPITEQGQVTFTYVKTAETEMFGKFMYQ